MDPDGLEHNLNTIEQRTKQLDKNSCAQHVVSIVFLC